MEGAGLLPTCCKGADLTGGVSIVAQRADVSPGNVNSTSSARTGVEHLMEVVWCLCCPLVSHARADAHSDVTTFKCFG